MKPSIRFVLLAAASLSLFACSPARTGVVNGALTTNLLPPVTIQANAPFALADSGRVWASPRVADDVTADADMSVDYAVYTDPSAPLSARFAYAAIIRFDDPAAWAFVPQGAKLPGSFGQVKPSGPPALEGTMSTLRVPSVGDWAAELLAANGAAVPEQWLAARWIYNLDSGGRAMAEYREPWPEGLEAPDGGIMPLRDRDAEFLRAFENRAAAVFSVDSARGDFSGAPRLTNQWQKPADAPDVVRLVGDIRREYHDDSSGDWD